MPIELDNADIANIERATLTAVSPLVVRELPGWLLPMDRSTIGRAKSAVPLSHEMARLVQNTTDAGQSNDGSHNDNTRTTDALTALIHSIEASYRAQGFRADFRVADVPSLAPLHHALTRAGYEARQPTLVQVGRVLDALALTSARPDRLTTAPHAQWAAVYLAQGFDAADGASRVQALSRGKDALYASHCENDTPVAAGTASFGHGWASIHGMRTAQSHRGQGLARRIVAGFAEAAHERGLTRFFLQVEEDNTAAQALYRRAGFETAWRYHYWRAV